MLRTYAILGLALFAVGCDDKPRPRKKKSTTVAQVVVTPEPPVPPVPPTPPVLPQPPVPPAEPVVKVVVASKNAVAIRISGIRSDKPQATSDKALSDAIQVAQVEIMRALQKLDPPVMAKPSLTKIRNEYIKKGSVREIQPTADLQEKWKKENVNADRSWVEFDVELSVSQIQQLRAGDRVNDGFRGAGVLLAVIVAAFGFLRIDAWSKGYLTNWLAIAAVVAAGLVALALWAGRNSVVSLAL